MHKLIALQSTDLKTFNVKLSQWQKKIVLFVYFCVYFHIHFSAGFFSLFYLMYCQKTSVEEFKATAEESVEIQSSLCS